ncbi:MAG: GntP family permease [Clostridia bacterium]
MVTGPMLLVIFLVGIAFVLVSIIKFRINPFLVLLMAAIFIGLLARMPIGEIPNTAATGFGNTLKGIGIIIGLGIVLGQILSEASGTEQIANKMVKAVGIKNSPLAMNLTGALISIPVFFDAAFVILISLAKQLAKKTKTPLITYATSLAVGLIVTHSLVIPTPGPVAVAGNMSANMGFFLLYSLIVALPASLLGGWIYGMYLGKGKTDALISDAAEQAAASLEETASEYKENTGNQNKPSGSLAIFVLLFPIVLILMGTVMSMVLPKDSASMPIFTFLGDKNIALLIGVIVAVLLLKKYFKKPLEEIMVDAGKSAGMIFLITGAGGALGNVINATGIGKYIVDTLSGWNVSVIVLAFILSQVLRAAQGSTTVALVTTSAILAPVAAQMGASPILVGLAICCGGVGISLPNDSGFWVVSRFANFGIKDTMKCWTVGGTIAGVTGFAVVLILNMFVGILPGL